MTHVKIIIIRVFRFRVLICQISQIHKKVLLRERKRHTARRVASARYAVLSNGGYPIQSWVGGVPHPVLAGGTPSSPGGWGYPIQSWPGGYPIQSWPGRYPIQSWPGGGVHPHTIQTWIGVPPHQPDGVPPCQGVDWQTNWKQYLPPSFGCGRQ